MKRHIHPDSSQSHFSLASLLPQMHSQRRRRRERTAARALHPGADLRKFNFESPANNFTKIKGSRKFKFESPANNFMKIKDSTENDHFLHFFFDNKHLFDILG